LPWVVDDTGSAAGVRLKQSESLQVGNLVTQKLRRKSEISRVGQIHGPRRVWRPSSSNRERNDSSSISLYDICCRARTRKCASAIHSLEQPDLTIQVGKECALRYVTLSLVVMALSIHVGGIRMSAQSDAGSTESRNKATVEASFKAWSNGTGSPFDLLADDATWTIVGRSVASKTYQGR
jgi:hypothetical protein